MTPAPQATKKYIHWQTDRRLQSRDRVWFITDIRTYTEQFHEWSPEQRWFKVGVYDLKTKRIGYVRFGLDDARAILKSGFSAPPWKNPATWGIELQRDCHDWQCEGRYRVRVRRIHLEPEVLVLEEQLRRDFERDGHRANATPGMWAEMVARVATENRIEDAALSMCGSFCAGDIKRIVGSVDVTAVLRRLVNEGALTKTGTKRGTRYEVAPPTIPTRIDWAG